MPFKPLCWVVRVGEYLGNHLSAWLKLKLYDDVTEEVVDWGVYKELNIQHFQRVKVVLGNKVRHYGFYTFIVSLFKAFGTEFKHVTPVTHAGATVVFYRLRLNCLVFISDDLWNCALF